MAIKFKKYQRFDARKAKYGVEHSIIDDAGNKRGTFKSMLFDPFNKYVELATERFNREMKDDPRAKGDFANIFAFVEICLLDWSDVKDENGKDVPFTKNAAFELLTEKWTEEDMDGEEIQHSNDWLALRLLQLSQDVNNYQSDPVAKVEAEVGN